MKRQILLTFGAMLLLPFVVTAAESEGVNTFATIPFVSGNNLTTQGFVTALYQMSIGLASVIVVVRLIMAGAKYMLSEVVSSKGEAKEDIKNALFGLLIILGAVLILGTINPKLVGLDVLNSGNPVNLNTNDEKINDDIGLKFGESFPASEVAKKCSTTGLGGSTLNEGCVKEAEAELLKSCKNGGGNKLGWKFDPNVSLGGYAYYSYTCEK